MTEKKVGYYSEEDFLAWGFTREQVYNEDGFIHPSMEIEGRPYWDQASVEGFFAMRLEILVRQARKAAKRLKQARKQISEVPFPLPYR